MPIQDLRKLLLIVLTGVAVRIGTLWVGRPEFTGWLNHTYYYFVQVRGLLVEGRLPYPDMPLLFWIDAQIGRALIAVGMQPDAAVVAATRLVMCLEPALIAVPVYGIILALNRGRSPRPTQWILVSLSAFLPLSVLYLPEFLQKNMLGLLLLATLILCSQHLLRRFDWKLAGVSATLVLSIVLSHFGTFAAVVIYGLALALASSIVHRSFGRFLVVCLLLTVSGGLGVALIGRIDAQRFRRLIDYARDSTDHSLVGALFVGGGNDTPRILASLVGILAFYGLLYGIYRLQSRRGTSLDASDRTFWLANLLFSGLLVLPVLDERLTGRLALFASVPLLVVFAHLERHVLRSPRSRWMGVALLASAVLMLTLGELVSSRVHNAHHQTILRDLREIEARQWLGPHDLVITRTGAEHVCNWFYGVRAGVITSLSLADFERYEDLWVLNPLDGTASGADVVDDATGWSHGYEFMRRNISMPAGLEPVFATENIELFELDQPPTNWVFSEEGLWQGYTEHDD